MCTHLRWVYNRYTHQKFLAKCGHCKSCLQEKAYKRASRIKNEYSSDKMVLFVTLTYDRSSCPFVRQQDVDARLDPLPIYREHSTRRVRVDTKVGRRYFDKRLFVPQVIGEIEHPNYDSFECSSFIRHLKYRERNIGVCYFRDVQLFKKRLNINLKRIYKNDTPYKVYSCMEYGSRTGRPHAHLLFFIRPSDETTFRAAISQAWPFASHYRTEKYIEVARDCANYVASYVNCGSNLHKFLSVNFKAKHSYSKAFGLSAKQFSLDSILSCIKRNDMSYLRGIGPRGKEVYTDFCIPKYVINRYFPLFKGYSQFTSFEVLDVLRNFILGKSFSRQVADGVIPYFKANYYSHSDIDKIRVRLVNAFDRFHTLTGLSLDDYVWNFVEAWQVYKNTNMRLWYTDDTVDWKYKFDNVKQLYDGDIHSPETKLFLEQTRAKRIDDFNQFPQNVNLSGKYESIYNFRTKEKDLNNFVMAHKYYYF